MSFMRMKVTTADQKMTKIGRSELFPQLVGGPGVDQPVHPERHARSLAAVAYCAWVVAITWPDASRWPQPYSSMPGSPKMSEEQTAEEPGDAVGVDDPEGVVHLGERPDLGEEVPGHPDDGRADQADEDGTLCR